MILELTAAFVCLQNEMLFFLKEELHTELFFEPRAQPHRFFTHDVTTVKPLDLLFFKNVNSSYFSVRVSIELQMTGKNLCFFLTLNEGSN